MSHFSVLSSIDSTVVPDLFLIYAFGDCDNTSAIHEKRQNATPSFGKSKRANNCL